jgi:hypothetical protein
MNLPAALVVQLAALCTGLAFIGVAIIVGHYATTAEGHRAAAVLAMIATALCTTSFLIGIFAA